MCNNKFKLHYSTKVDLENGKYMSDVVIFNRFRLQPLNILDKIQFLSSVWYIFLSL